MEHLRCAFRRGDTSEATRIYIENRISWQTYQETAREVASARAQAANRLAQQTAPKP